MKETTNFKEAAEQAKKVAEQKRDNTELKAAANYFAYRLHKQEKRPDQVDLDMTRGVFWMAYRQLVYQETRLEVKAEAIRTDKEMSAAMLNICKWILKEPGEYDPNRSLYIYGDVGVGKTTLARAAHLTTEFFKVRYKWQTPFLPIAAMDQLFYDFTTSQDISGFNQLKSGNYIIDELKEDHAKVKYYGNEIRLLGLLLSTRHEAWKRNGNRTMITTNIPPGDLAAMITDTASEASRIRDRMKQEYNRLHLKGENKRHPKHRL